MQQITVKVSGDTIESLDKEAEERDLSRSEYIREIFDDRHADKAEIEDLRARVDELQTNVDRLQNEKRLILKDREEKAKLAKYAERERTISERWHQAGFTTRMKWRLFGMPGPETDA